MKYKKGLTRFKGGGRSKNFLVETKTRDNQFRVSIWPSRDRKKEIFRADDHFFRQNFQKFETFGICHNVLKNFNNFSVQSISQLFQKNQVTGVENFFMATKELSILIIFQKIDKKRPKIYNSAIIIGLYSNRLDVFCSQPIKLSQLIMI